MREKIDGRAYKCVFLLLLCLIACAREETTTIRLVDATGNPVKIDKMIPKFNEEQLAKQRNAFNNEAKKTEVNKFRQDYNDGGTITAPQPSNMSKYPNDIFADRITNYNEDENIISAVKPKATPQMENEFDEEQLRNEINLPHSTTSSKKEAQTRPYTAPPTQQDRRNPVKQIFIQIGVFSEEKNATLAYNKYRNIKTGRIERQDKKFKVILGPYNSRKDAERDLEKIIKTGHFDVYIMEQN